MFTRNKLMKLIWKWAAPLAAVAALALACFFYFYSPGQKTVQFRPSCGSARPATKKK
jgi:hypothetical protein